MTCKTLASRIKQGVCSGNMTPRFYATLFEARGRFGARVVGHLDTPWTPDALENALPLTVTGVKGGSRLFALAEYRAGASRGKAGIEHMTGVMLDCDYADPGDFVRVTEALTAKGLAFLAYTTYSHMSPDKVHKDTGRHGDMEGFRVFMPVSRILTPDEYRVLVPCLFGYEVPEDPPHYAQEVEGVWVRTKCASVRAKPRGWDPVSSRPAQAYYMPECPPEREDLALFDAQAGDPIDVDTVLRREVPRGVRAFFVPREYQQPTEEGEGLLADIVTALMDAGHHVQSANSTGWRRTACPACAPGGVQRSPSCTFRANGDFLELRCHCGCARRDILASLGLSDEGRLREPGYLEERLTEQLAAQAPKRVPLAVNDAVARLEADLRMAVQARKPYVINYPCGVGKSVAAAKIIAEEARKGECVCYATQEHKVAIETMSLLPEDVRARAVHLHSPLVQIAGGLTCPRADEVKDLVFEYGIPLRGKICPSCPMKDTCSALAAANERDRRKGEATVVFCSHAGIRQLFPEGEVSPFKLIVDEMPSVFEEVEVSREALQQIAERAPLPSTYIMPRKAAYEIARAWMAGEEPGYIIPAPGEPPVSAIAVAQEWGRLAIDKEEPPPVGSRAVWKAADAVIRLAVHRASGGEVFGLANKAPSIRAMLPDPCHRALVRQCGVLLSATPMTAALPDFEHIEQAVSDSAPVRRVMVLRNNRGSSALTKTYADGRGGFTRREPEEGEALGVPWDVVADALNRACAEAYMHDCQRVLFVSFKGLIDALRGRDDILDGRPIELAHYGALRGKNDWMEGRPAEVSVVYLFGTPRFALYPTFRSLGLDPESADAAWRQYAAGELEQAAGRLRTPRRKKPCTIVVEGDIAPSSWHTENVDEIIVD